MSKGYSGLFTGTAGSKASINKMRAKAKEAIQQLIDQTPGSKSKAMVVGAFDAKTGKTVASFAGQIPSKIASMLKARAEAIGGVGTHGLTERNTVGVCAEFHVVNNLLLGGSRWEDIHLMPAVRPRTGQVIPFCANCQAMFSDIIDK